MSDNTETIITFTHADGRVIEIDHLGIATPENRGEFAIYEGDRQIGEFMLPWAILTPEAKAAYDLPGDAELIAQATLALDDDPRVLTQTDVAEAFANAVAKHDVSDCQLSGAEATYHWVTMHDDPEAEYWVGITNSLTRDEYLAIMHSAAVGVRLYIDPEWIHPETTATPDPTTLSHLEMSEDGTLAVFLRPRDTGVLLRVAPTGHTRSPLVEVVITAVHDLADHYALPGTPQRRILDMFIHGTDTDPNPSETLWYDGQLDGYGDPVSLGHHDTTDYQRASNAAETRTKELGRHRAWAVFCTFPDELLYALQARGHWNDTWTPESYQRIAGRFARVFGIPLHPDDPSDPATKVN